MTIEEFRKNIENRKTSNLVYKKEIQECREQIAINISKLGCVKDLLHIIETLAFNRRNVMKTSIEGIITKALRLLYGSNYSVSLDYKEKNNRSCLDVTVIKDIGSGIVKRNTEGFGGGVSDTVSIPLRLMVLKGSDTGDILFLDEAYKHADKNMADRIGTFLRGIAHEMGIQLILCSHDLRILEYAEKGFHLTSENGSVVVNGLKTA